MIKEETTFVDLEDDEQTQADLNLLRYDMKNMTERWLRSESRYDSILTAQNNINIKVDILLALQLFITILLGVTVSL